MLLNPPGKKKIILVIVIMKTTERWAAWIRRTETKFGRNYVSSHRSDRGGGQGEQGGPGA